MPPVSGSALPPPSLPREFFQRALERGRLSHAYLFLGPDGSGRRHFARELAKAIFCPQGTPCGSCPSCSSIEHGNHPAVHFCGPADGKSRVEIAEIRDLAGRIHLRRSSFLIQIIEHADRLTLPAANALLKTLEEPAGKAVLILVAASSGALLPTIVSRCQQISFAASRAGEKVATGDLESLTRLLQAEDPDSFHANREPREFVGSLFPGADSHREAVRLFLDTLLSLERIHWSPPPCLDGGTSPRDSSAERLEQLLDLRTDIEKNVNADLVLEGALAAWKAGRTPCP